MARKKSSYNPGKWPQKAYKNLDFITSPDGRTLRVLAEFLEPAARFRRNRIWNTVAFFGSARTPSPVEARRTLKQVKAETADRERLTRTMKKRLQRAERDLDMSRYYEDAARLSEKITCWSLGIPEPKRRFHICSGGGGGIMEAVNLGDSFYGPLDPAGTARILMKLKMPAVRGNEDRILVQPPEGRPHPNTLAYAQGESMTAFLILEYGLTRLLNAVERQGSFKRGIELELSGDMSQITARWKKSLAERPLWLVILSGAFMPLLFFVAAVLAVAAIVRARLRGKRVYESLPD